STGTKNHKFNSPGIKQQIETFIANNSEQSNPKDFSKTLFTIWDTGNDYYFSDMSISPLDSVKSLINALHLLVKSIPTVSSLLILNLPDISCVPAFKTVNETERKLISKMIGLHNKCLLEHLLKFSSKTKVNIMHIRCDRLFNILQTDFGIINCIDVVTNIYELDYNDDIINTSQTSCVKDSNSYFY
ncbi:7179_t:CDS:2, partial [Scutellospora calospora]